MQNPATITPPQLTEKEELDWRLYEPRTKRLQILIGNEDWRGLNEPRLWLREYSDEGEPVEDCITIYVPPEMFFTKTWPQNHSVPDGRAGTWQRYLARVSWLKAATRGLGWTLTDEERALMDALEAKAGECPAWVRARIGEGAAA